MRVIEVRQPWAQLIADRRRNYILKNWQIEPTEETFALFTPGHLKLEACEPFGYDPARLPLNSVLAVFKILRCVPRSVLAHSRFDTESTLGQQFAFVVRVLHKLRRPMRVGMHEKARIWEYPELEALIAEAEKEKSHTV